MTRPLLRATLALALGVGIGLGLSVVSTALFGDRGIVYAIVVTVVGASIYLWNSFRWLNRMRAEMEADNRRLQELVDSMTPRD